MWKDTIHCAVTGEQIEDVQSAYAPKNVSNQTGRNVHGQARTFGSRGFVHQVDWAESVRRQACGGLTAHQVPADDGVSASTSDGAAKKEATLGQACCRSFGCGAWLGLVEENSALTNADQQRRRSKFAQVHDSRSSAKGNAAVFAGMVSAPSINEDVASRRHQAIYHILAMNSGVVGTDRMVQALQIRFFGASSASLLEASR